jgi:hypothetical protein
LGHRCWTGCMRRRAYTVRGCCGARSLATCRRSRAARCSRQECLCGRTRAPTPSRARSPSCVCARRRACAASCSSSPRCTLRCRRRRRRRYATHRPHRLRRRRPTDGAHGPGDLSPITTTSPTQRCCHLCRPRRPCPQPRRRCCSRRPWGPTRVGTMRRFSRQRRPRSLRPRRPAMAVPSSFPPSSCRAPCRRPLRRRRQKATLGWCPRGHRRCRRRQPCGRRGWRRGPRAEGYGRCAWLYRERRHASAATGALAGLVRGVAVAVAVAKVGAARTPSAMGSVVRPVTAVAMWGWGTRTSWRVGSRAMHPACA